MNKEIKELLDYLKEFVNENRLEQINLSRWVVGSLLDYITNLQQAVKNTKETADDMLYELNEENERLKELANPKTQIFIDTQDMEERYGEELYKEYLEEQVKDYKSRNEKAKIEISELLNRYLFEEDFYIEDFHLDKVLKTLDGRSDE